ncbi:DUF4215 domain-containing protein [Enhygromyxa salina]|uniref:DUF4215 domain-containing protein n=1 Tax=Enhygromyxa salina TaxID=215803 RepID=UPI001FD2CFD6|nr:DUF4215 domain-containing protein [Enhygromyxa salina]
MWVNISGKNSVGYTGQTQDDIARLVIEVVARHNESNRSPKLYFAGFTNEAWDPVAPNPIQDFPAGITITSMSCASAKLGTPCAEGGKACASSTVRGIGNMPPDTDPLGWIMVLPTQCEGVNESLWSMSIYADLGQVLLHETGHVLGLFHANRSKATCEAGGNVHGGLVDGTTGVMQTAVPASFAATRSWRRDDLGGLEHLYGAAGGTFEIAWWKDASYPDYPPDSAATSVIKMDVSRTAVVSHRPPSEVQALVTTAPDGRVIHRLMTVGGDLSPDLPDMVVDPGPSGVTWSLPAVTIGGDGTNERLFIAWMANESLSNSQLTLRTAIRSTNVLNWAYVDHPGEFRVNRLAAGYASSIDAFVVTTLTPVETEVSVVLFDGNGEPLGSLVVLEGLQAFDVGGVLCDGARCLIPFSTSTFGGPDFGVAEIEVDSRAPAVTLLSTELLNTANTFGSLTLLDDGQELIGRMGERRFLIGGYPGLMPDGAEFYGNPRNEWALGIGLWGSPNFPDQRLFQARRVECGNQIVQGSEQCDDGNSSPGDGCSNCVVEPGGGESGGSGSGETDGGGLDDGSNGCDCQAGDSRSPWFGLLSLLGAVAFVGGRGYRRTRRTSTA